MTEKRKIISITLNFLVVFFSVLGLIDAFVSSGFMDTGTFLYFTIQSNIWIASICLIFAIYGVIGLKKQVKIPQFLFVVKYVFTCSIMVTFLVFMCLLIPQMIMQGTAKYLISIQNICLHFISPLIAFFSFVFFDKFNVKKHTFLYSAIMPLLYMIFIYLLVIISNTAFFRTIDGFAYFPYFFMDYKTNGWFSLSNEIWKLGTFWWFAILFVLGLNLGYLILLANKKATSDN